MTGLTVSLVRSWRPEALDDVATALATAADTLDTEIDGLVRDVDGVMDTWRGPAASVAWDTAVDIEGAGNKLAFTLTEAAASLRRSASEIGYAREHALSTVSAAIGEGFIVEDTGAVLSPPTTDSSKIERATVLADDIRRALDAVALADSDAAVEFERILADLDAPDAPMSAAVAGIVGGASLLPSDPKELNEFWKTLSQNDKDALYDSDRFVGNRDGIPAADRDHYNRMNLEALMVDADSALAKHDSAHPDWAEGENIPSRPAGYSGSVDEWTRWADYQKWSDARPELQTKAAELDHMATQVAPSAGPDRLLLHIDNDGLGAIALNNPDTARNVLTYVPGTGENLLSMNRGIDRSMIMLNDAADPANAGETSVVAWYGYNTPPDFPYAGLDRYAEDGAAALESFQNGLDASNESGRLNSTVLGHSYGSTMIGAAAQDGHTLNADNVIFVGSPGVNANNASDLSLTGIESSATGRHVYSALAENDIINIAIATVHGPSPTSGSFGGQQIEAGPGPAGPWGFSFSTEAHSSYWDPGNPARYEITRIVTGGGA